MKTVKNAAGRTVPLEIDGVRLRPFAGAHADEGGERKRTIKIPAAHRYSKKRLGSLDEAIEACEIRDGMTISFHHHLRNGDFLLNRVMNKLAAKGIRDLVLAPSALFPVHEPLVGYLENGVLSHVHGSMNGPVGRACSLGKMKKTAILRSHGGRYRAIQDGDLQIDVAFIAAPCADEHGNANGLQGPSACGPLGFALADSRWADRVVVVTDHPVPFPCVPWSIEGGFADHVVVSTEPLGDPEQIVFGTTEITRSPTRLMIADYAARFVAESGLMSEPHFSFQAGAGGISLAFVKAMSGIMARDGVTADFIRGGSTRFMVDMLNSGLTRFILDGQSFDPVSIDSLRENPRHVETNPFVSYNIHSKGCFASRVAVAVLGATEIDLNFNVNVNTHSDGWLLHGIGGFMDAADAQVTLITAPLVRNRLPIVVDEVTTLTTPGETVDVVVTERGVAINPARQDLIDRMRGSSLPICKIEQLHEKATALCGKPHKPVFGDRIVALVEYRDGTVIDAVRQVEPSEF